MYHSISFYLTDDTSNYGVLQKENHKPLFNTWDDWHLVPTARPYVAPPTRKVKTIDVPGINGTVDISNSLTGYPLYEDRTGQWQFYVINDYGRWSDRFSKIMSSLNGMKLRCVLEDDPGYYYEGYFDVSGWDSPASGPVSQITISYTLNPYKWTRETAASQGWRTRADAGTYKPANVSWTDIIVPNAKDPNAAFKFIELFVNPADLGSAPVNPSITVNTSDGEGIIIHYIPVGAKGSGAEASVSRVLLNGTHALPDLVFTNLFDKDNMWITFEYIREDLSKPSTTNVSVNFRRGEF